eukprot:Nitzschia sp. Nitz4//scaffold38_size140716//53689//55150//NITZ4_003139-RA/size140716-snap-gene-0.142-mRNA-1//1//CDS//3329550054//1182//frame0
MDTPAHALWGNRTECCNGGCSPSSTDSSNIHRQDELAAFSKLSIQEREKALEELHGVAGDIEETPELVKEPLSRMRLFLSKLHNRKRKHWDRALMLLFLRGSRFDPHEAAKKMALHYQHKAELFPMEKLPSRITLDDLDGDDMACMRNGTYQPLELKDQAGRTINCLDFSRIHFKHWKNEMMAMLEDEAAQTKGIVEVFRLTDEGHSIAGQGLEVVRDGGHVFSSFPFRRVALHCCYDDPKLKPILFLIRSSINKDTQARQRFHFGSRLECQYLLRGYGIRIEAASWGDAKHRADTIESYLQRRRQVEAQRRLDEEVMEKSRGIIRYPSRLDVLVGRGKPYQDFPGNNILLAIVAEYSDLYGQSYHCQDKTILSLRIVQKIQQDGGRFLQRTMDGWIVVEDAVAREKVAQALRMRVKKQRDGTTDIQEENACKRKRALS